MRVDLLEKKEAEKIAKGLSPPYDLIWNIGYSTGLRISDVLNLRAEIVGKSYVYVTEQKTGKRRRIYIRKKIRERIAAHVRRSALPNDAKLFVCSRQTVWRNFKKASAGISKNVGTHSMRKSYALQCLKKSHSLKTLQKNLNHSMQADTINYIMSNQEIEMIKAKGA